MTGARDAWSEGYRAGLAGKTYADGETEPCAWHFGCGEGMKERNRRGLDSILAEIREREALA